MNVHEEIKKLEKEMHELSEKLGELRNQREPEKIGDYQLHDTTGKAVALGDLFGDKDDLILVHNMGKGCAYCTLWADGFKGFVPYLSDRASFVVSSADQWETAAEFANDRGWNFPVVSSHGGPFKKDMGFETDDGMAMPGVSIFHRNEDGSIVRTGSSFFGPRDQFCSIWHMFDMLPGGWGEWNPAYHK